MSYACKIRIYETLDLLTCVRPERNQRLHRRSLEARKEVPLARVAEVQKGLLLLARVFELTLGLVAWARRKPERERVQAVTLHGTPNACDPIIVDALDLVSREWVCGQEDGRLR